MSYFGCDGAFKAFQNDVAASQHENHPSEFRGELPKSELTEEDNEKNMKALEKYLSELESGYDEDYELMNNNFF